MPVNEKNRAIIHSLILASNSIILNVLWFVLADRLQVGKLVLLLILSVSILWHYSFFAYLNPQPVCYCFLFLFRPYKSPDNDLC